MKKSITASPEDFDPGQYPERQSGDNSRNGQTYGSRELAEEILAVCRQPINQPEVNKKYILAIAKSRGRNGEPDIRDFSSRQFGQSNSELEGQSRHCEEVIKVETAGAELSCKEVSAKLAVTPPTITHHREGLPWTLFTRLVVACLALLSVIGLLMGINTTATTLMASGIAAFESPFRAYSYSMVPILLAVGIKIVATLIRQPLHRQTYTLAVSVMAIVLGTIWAASFAKTFPGMAQSVTDIVNNIANSNGVQSDSSGSWWMVFISIMAEVFGASACWLVIQVICDRHQKTVVEPNPVYVAHQKDQDSWNKRRNENRRLAGQLAGKLEALSDARKHFVEECVGHFHAALKIAADQNDLKAFLDE